MTSAGLSSNLSLVSTTQDIPKTFGERVQRRRLTLEMSVYALADQCSVNAKTIERWERGETEPKIDDAGKVAIALGVSLDYLAGVEAMA